MDAETWVIILTLIGYLLFMLWVGYRVSNRIQGIDNYILAGRNLPWFVLALTFLATIANVNQVLGQPGFAYSSRIAYLFWTNAAALTIGAILLPRVGTRLRGLNLSTVTDFAQARFSRAACGSNTWFWRGRWFGACSSSPSTCSAPPF